MKILVVTFTKGVNPGTFIQSLGVQTGLKKIFPGSEIDFLSFPDFKKGNAMSCSGSRSFKTYILQKGTAAYRLLKYKKLENKYFHHTKQTIDLFDYTDEVYTFFQSYDLVVIGSDTILEKAEGKDGKIGLNWMPFDIPKIYFAASASPANFKINRDLREIASKALYIGLRDDLTIDLFVNSLGILKGQIFKQPDPSYLLDVSSFDLKPANKKLFKKGDKYVLYNFNAGFPYRKELADILRRIGYTVVSTAYNPYADICLDKLDALEWAGVFRYIDLSVTERFHDTVFTLRNCRPVIAIDWEQKRFASDGNSKTLGILSDYGLKQFHVNLQKFDQLKFISNLVVESQRIDLDAIKRINQKYCDYAIELLDIIKSKVIL